MPNWQDRVAAKRAQAANAIPAAWRLPSDVLARWAGGAPVMDFFDKETGILSAEEREMTECTAGEAIQKLQSGEWTSEAVTRAVCHRAAVADQLLGCLTEMFFDEAIERAKSLDAEFKRTGKPAGPLHGLPLSIKDLFFYPGHDSTKGLVAYIGHPVPKDAEMPVPVKVFWEAGAVFYAKTTVPQSMMTFESGNAIFGRAKNPHNRGLTPGGSSGGEGALIAFKGSHLGIGTDIGGSVRIPAYFSGIYGLKPTFGRISRRQAAHNGTVIGVTGGSGVMGVQGPMARSVADLEIYMRVEVGAEEWKLDADIIPIPWRTVQLPNKLKIGYFYSTGLFQLPSAVERPVKAAVEKLATAGHELVAFPTPFAAEMLGLWYIFGTGCGLHNLRKTVDEGGEGWDVAVEPFVDWGVGDGYLGKKVAAWAAAGWGPEDEVVKRVREYEKPGISVAELQKYVGERDKIRQVYNDTWTRMGLDAVVCPGFGVPHGKAPDAFAAIVHTVMFNVLDYAAGNIPHDHVDPAVDTKNGGPYWNLFDREIAELFDPKVFEGAPSGVQVVCRRFEEEKCLEVMRVVDGLLNG